MSDSSPITPARIAIGALALVAVGLIGTYAYRDAQIRATRQALWEELVPVPLKNCEMGRLGRERDGGYVVCTNLLDGVKAAYSYGIAGEDSFGCAASERLDIEVHQYDCFDLREVDCPEATAIFHPECVAGTTFTEDERLFDTIANQLDKTGHPGEHVLMKMDIDGAEVDSLLQTPPETLALIDQLAIELHGVESEGILELVRYLKEHFHLADVHYNNFGCLDGHEPFPSVVPEALFVNKALDEVDPNGKVPFPNPAWSVNNPDMPDCQVER